MSTTALVKALLAFGNQEVPPQLPEAPRPKRAQEEEEHEVDDEDEMDDVVVGGARVALPVAQGGSAKGKGKGTASSDEANLAALSIDSTSRPVTTATTTTTNSRDLKRLLRSSEHVVNVLDEQGKEEVRVLTSWKMQDFAYKRDPCPFPTRARGLFTEKLQVGKGKGEEGAKPKDQEKSKGEEYRIVARGYDKFFNVGEVSWTQVRLFFLFRFQFLRKVRRLTELSSLVGEHTPARFRSVRADAKIQRLHHLHRRLITSRHPRHFEAQYRRPPIRRD